MVFTRQNPSPAESSVGQTRTSCRGSAAARRCSACPCWWACATRCAGASCTRACGRRSHGCLVPDLRATTSTTMLLTGELFTAVSIATVLPDQLFIVKNHPYRVKSSISVKPKRRTTIHTPAPVFVNSLSYRKCCRVVRGTVYYLV